MGKSRKESSRLSKKTLTESIVGFFRENQQNPVNIKRVFDALKLKTHPARGLCFEIVQELLEDGFLVENQGLFQLAVNDQFTEGEIGRASCRERV